MFHVSVYGRCWNICLCPFVYNQTINKRFLSFLFSENRQKASILTEASGVGCLLLILKIIVSHLDSSCSNNWRSKCSFAKYWGSFETDVASGTGNYIHFYKPQVEGLTKEMFYDPQANNQGQKQVQILKFHHVSKMLYKRNHLRLFQSGIFQTLERCLNCRKIPFTLSHLISGFNIPRLWCVCIWPN